MKPPAAGRTAIILPVHNRRETTLACLRRLAPETCGDGWLTLVVDAGSTDGTAGAVSAEFPTVTVLAGDGALWWTGAIALGMAHALAAGADTIVWLNDDALPVPGALARLVALSRAREAVVGGVTYLPGDRFPAYSGMRLTAWKLAPLDAIPSEPTAVDALHGNFVCVPSTIARRVGLPDAAGLPHALGDLDYTLRVRIAGIPVLLDSGARAEGTPNLSLNYRSWLLSEIPIAAWWRELIRPGSHLNARAQWRFHLRHRGARGAAYCLAMLAKLALVSGLRLLIPTAWLRRWRGTHSAAWQHEQRHAPRP